MTFDPNDPDLIDKMMDVSSSCEMEVEIVDKVSNILESSLMCVQTDDQTTDDDGHGTVSAHGAHLGPEPPKSSPDKSVNRALRGKSVQSLGTKRAKTPVKKSASASSSEESTSDSSNTSEASTPGKKKSGESIPSKDELTKADSAEDLTSTIHVACRSPSDSALLKVDSPIDVTLARSSRSVYKMKNLSTRTMKIPQKSTQAIATAGSSRNVASKSTAKVATAKSSVRINISSKQDSSQDVQKSPGPSPSSSDTNQST